MVAYSDWVSDAAVSLCAQPLLATASVRGVAGIPPRSKGERELVGEGGAPARGKTFPRPKARSEQRRLDFSSQI